MINVVAVQAEIEYRQQRMMEEAEQHRRAKFARANSSTPARTGRVKAALGGRAPWHRRHRDAVESKARTGGSSASAA